LGGQVSGPGKVYKSGQPTGSGMMIQLGVELIMSAGSTVGRGWLRFPIVVTK